MSSPYYWLFLFPVISAATSFGFVGTVISILLACAAYASFLLFLGPNQYIPVEERLWRHAKNVQIPGERPMCVAGYGQGRLEKRRGTPGRVRAMPDTSGWTMRF